MVSISVALAKYHHLVSQGILQECILFQVEQKRLITDEEGVVWLRIEDAGYMDEEGRVWLVGRVKWRVERQNRTFWSTTVEQKVKEKREMNTSILSLCNERVRERK